jgi:hypothetical protein
LGKDSQLITGPPHFALQAGFGQGCFQVGALDDGRSSCLNGGGDAAQKGAFVLCGEIAVNRDGDLGQVCRALQIGGGGGKEFRFESGAGGGVHSGKCGSFGSICKADQGYGFQVGCELHSLFPSKTVPSAAKAGFIRLLMYGLMLAAARQPVPFNWA